MMKSLRVSSSLLIISSSLVIITCLLLIITCLFLILQVVNRLELLQVPDCHEVFLDPPKGRKEIDASSGTGSR